MTPQVRMMAEKYLETARRLEETLGDLTLFGLFEHQEGPGRFDFVVSAPALPNNAQGIRRVAQYLPRVDSEEPALMGAIVTVPADSEFVRAVTRAWPHVHGELVETGSAVYGGVPITQAILLVSDANAISAQREQRLAA